MFAGVDTHKDTLAVAIIDGAGRPHIVEEIPNTAAGFKQLTATLDQHVMIRIGMKARAATGERSQPTWLSVVPD